jgi:methyltransferase family protein
MNGKYYRVYRTIKAKLKTILPEFLWSSIVKLGKIAKFCIGYENKRKVFLEILPKNSIGAELGVFRGHWSKIILEIVKPKELHLIDGWWKISGEKFPWVADTTNFGSLTTKEAYNEARDIVKKYDKNKVCYFHVENDLVYLEKIDNKYFDWVYIDSNHIYEHAIKELEILKDKVKDDGIISGHDWVADPAHKFHGVCKAVNEFCRKYGWKVIKTDEYTQWAIKKSKGNNKDGEK